LELDGSARVHHERQGEVERLGQCSGFSPDLGREQVGLDERMRARVRSLPDVAELLDAYDAQLRAHVHDRLPDSVRVERDGPLVRTASEVADSSSIAASPASTVRSSTR
jgi:hypothetical protein